MLFENIKLSVAHVCNHVNGVCGGIPSINWKLQYSGAPSSGTCKAPFVWREYLLVPLVLGDFIL